MLKELLLFTAVIGGPLMTGEVPISEVLTSEVVSEVTPSEDIVVEDEGLTSEELEAITDYVLDLPIVQTILAFSGTAIGAAVLTLIIQVCRSFFTGKKTKRTLDKVNENTQELFNTFLKENLKPVIENFTKAISSNSEAQAKLAQIQVLGKTNNTEAQIAVLNLVSEMAVNDEKTKNFCKEAIKDIEKKAKIAEKENEIIEAKKKSNIEALKDIDTTIPIE